MDDHALCAGRGARSWKAAHPVDLHEAGAAGTASLLIGVFAQLGNVGAGTFDGVEYARPRRHRYWAPVHCKGEGLGWCSYCHARLDLTSITFMANLGPAFAIQMLAHFFAEMAQQGAYWVRRHLP